MSFEDAEMRESFRKIQVNLNKATAASPGVLPPGEYLAKVWSAKPIAAKTGTKGLDLTFGVLKHPKDSEKCEEFRVTMWLSEKNLSYVKFDLDRLGLMPWELHDLIDMDLSKVSTPKRITLKVEEYEGRQHNRIVLIQEVKA